MMPVDVMPRASVWFERRGIHLIGDREASLLEAIERTRSIKEAAVAAGVSYRTAWSCLQAMEKTLGKPVVSSRAGGPGGGATTLTDDTRELLRLYNEVRRRVAAQVEQEFRTAAETAR